MTVGMNSALCLDVQSESSAGLDDEQVNDDIEINDEYALYTGSSDEKPSYPTIVFPVLAIVLVLIVFNIKKK